MGLPARSTITPKVLQKAVWAGVNNVSYPLASSALLELAGLSLSAKQIRHWVQRIGEARLSERGQALQDLQALTLPQRRAGNPTACAPELAVILMDGGRYQRRDNFRTEPTHKPGGTHWREDKVGCLLSMASNVHACDPTPEFPAWLATSSAVAELAKMSEKTAFSATAKETDNGPAEAHDETLYEPPQLLAREVLASGVESETFGWQLETRAWELGFPAAQRQAFVADGASANWKVQRRHFPHATPILDLMHALSYAWSAAQVVDQGQSYPRWAKWIWQGQVARVITALDEQQNVAGMSTDESVNDDSQQPIQRARTYFTNQQARMNYPEYRRQGLPLTSSHIESTIKQINRRVKGSEKFWRPESAEAILQLRADALSDSRPLDKFWSRWLKSNTGSNRYQTAA